MTGIRWRSLLLTVALVCLFSGFAYANFLRWQETGHPVGLGAVFLEGMTALLFVVRRPPKETSGHWLAWVSAPVGAFAMLLARPVENPNDGPFWLFEILQLGGFALALAALGFLGRSFGIVAAVRQVKTSGLYSFVRHPAYAAYLLSYSCYVAESPTARNLGLFLLSTAGQLVRIREEERVLGRDPTYRHYQVRVRYRLVPFLY
jgi:protein-S-isoprenylcysteine O-methyltransferase Ste14